MKTHRRKTHCFKKPITALELAIKKFNSWFLHVIQDNDIANMDQTLLLFVLQDKRTSNLECSNPFTNPIGFRKVLIITIHKTQRMSKHYWKRGTPPFAILQPSWSRLCAEIAVINCLKMMFNFFLKTTWIIT